MRGNPDSVERPRVLGESIFLQVAILGLLTQILGVIRATWDTFGNILWQFGLHKESQISKTCVTDSLTRPTNMA